MVFQDMAEICAETPPTNHTCQCVYISQTHTSPHNYLYSVQTLVGWMPIAHALSWLGALLVLADCPRVLVHVITVRIYTWWHTVITIQHYVAFW